MMELPTVFSRWRQPPPEPPFYKKRPVATAAVILSIIGMFVLGPVGAIYKGMTEELKKKADYETVILILKQQEKKDDRQWKEIERNRNNKQTISTPKNMKVVTGAKIVLTPEEFNTYMNLSTERRVAYKKYLENAGKDVRGLP